MLQSTFKLEYNKKDITKDIYDYVLNINYTDFEHGQSDEVEIIFEDSQKLYSNYFKGQSYIQQLSTERVNTANVTFEPKCRNNWHIHHNGGQILLVTSGRGYYQEWENPLKN